MPLENEDNIPYGFLNPVDTTHGPGKAVLNVDNQPFSKTLREVAKDRFTRDVLGGVSEYTAICLAAAPKDLAEDNTIAGLNSFGVQVQANSQVRFFGRIPEMHAHLPIPSGPEDFDVIRMYPLFAGSVDLGDPGVGQLMRVSFKNVYNQEGPVYLGPSYSGNKTATNISGGENQISNGGSAANSQSPQGGSRYVEEPLTPSDPNYKQKLEEKMKTVYRPYGSESKNNSKYNLNIIPRGPIFQQSKRDGNVLNAIIVHETAGSGPNVPTENGLLKNGTGVHFMVDQEGMIFSYNDPKFQVYHGSEMNSRSIGIEVINIYNAYRKKDGDTRDVVYGKWVSPASGDPKSENSYLVPTKKCLESVFKLIKNLCITYQIPIAFPSVINSEFVWGQSPGIRQSAGICQHQCYSTHADGAFLVHYVICRFNDMSVNQAYDSTMKNASTTKRGERTPLRTQSLSAGFGK